MSALLAESSSSLTEIVIVSVAAACGIIVFVGLGIEKIADILDSKFLGEYKAHKSLELAGWCILMFGIIVEIGVAVWSANDAWQTRQAAIKNNPLNQPITYLRADVKLALTGTNLITERYTALEIYKKWKPPKTQSESYLVVLQCVKYESNAGSINGRPVLFISLEYEWPTERWGEAGLHKGVLEQTNLTPAEFDKEFFVAGFWPPPIEWKGTPIEIFEGSFILTMNGSVRRTILFPKSFDAWLFCSVMTNRP